ncbi:hypothetical protein [Streptomyces sp. NPDC086782]|uniref:hypothetical protein n=1 Tax=Streptomyces sp. NPDC086782 TaxID=3365757 RepID=UPI003803992E
MANDLFEGYRILDRTKNFIITYGSLNGETGPGTGDAAARATAIAEVCEQDLALLQHMFGCDFQTGGRNRYLTHVHVPPGNPNGGAINWGWNDSRAKISVDGTKDPALLKGGYAAFQEYARFLFVAELAEVLMDFTSFGWWRGSSDGEALSIILGTELHPVGYSQVNNFPRSKAWLNSDRPNWVDANERTDANAVSYGCGILFLNYLRWQCDFSLEQIIQTCSRSGKHGGNPHLAERFDALTHESEAWAWPGFDRLLRDCIAPGMVLGTDNPFPLYGPAERRVYLTLGKTDHKELSSGKPATVHLKLGSACEARDYIYWPTRVWTRISVTATGRGFAAADFAWSVNGSPIPPNLTTGRFNVDVSGVTRTPDGREAPYGNYMSKIDFEVEQGNNQSVLHLSNYENKSNYELTVTVNATESPTAPPSPPKTASLSTDEMTEVSFRFEDRYYRDLVNCNPIIRDVAVYAKSLADEIRAIKEDVDPLPDPYPVFAPMGLLSHAEKVINAIESTAVETGIRAVDLRLNLASPRVLRTLFSATSTPVAVDGHRREPQNADADSTDRSGTATLESPAEE